MMTITRKMEDLRRLVPAALSCSLFAIDVTTITIPTSSNPRNVMEKESPAGLAMVAALHEEAERRRQRNSVNIVTKATALTPDAKLILLSTFEDSNRTRSERSFLSSCFLCRKKLQGIDIFMYRGDMAFCSAECRTMQMANEYWPRQRRKRDTRIRTSGSCCSNKLMFSIAGLR